MASTLPTTSTTAPNPTLDPSPLPVSHLESLRSKITQMVESIQLLQRTIEVGGHNVMPAWPDILSKYTILLSQSHNLSTSLVANYGNPSRQTSGVSQTPVNPYEKLALHPSVPMTDAQLDNDLIPLLRNQQTTDVLRLENETVKHLAEHMSTRGSLGVLAPSASMGPSRRLGMDRTAKKPTYDDVLRECEQIKVEHDERVDRAVRAVMLLREKYDWKARVEVDQEEPEELDWDPRLVAQLEGKEDLNMNVGEGESNSEEEEEELEEVLGQGDDHSSAGTPSPMVEE